MMCSTYISISMLHLLLIDKPYISVEPQSKRRWLCVQEIIVSSLAHSLLNTRQGSELPSYERI